MIVLQHVDHGLWRACFSHQARAWDAAIFKNYLYGFLETRCNLLGEEMNFTFQDLLFYSILFYPNDAAASEELPDTDDADWPSPPWSPPEGGGDPTSIQAGKAGNAGGKGP